MIIEKQVYIFAVFNGVVNADNLAFKWVTLADIQKYLDQESVIEIGKNYSLADAIRIENDMVTSIVAYLNGAYEITADNGIEPLRVITAQLVASEIGFARLGASLGNSLTSWASRLHNNAWSALARYYINQNLPLQKKNVSLPIRLIYAKRLARVQTRAEA